MNTNIVVVKKRPSTAVTVNKEKFIFIINISFNELNIVFKNTFG